jgi:hypothetical protein
LKHANTSFDTIHQEIPSCLIVLIDWIRRNLSLQLSAIDQKSH